jgi:hypothetical protein
MVGRGAARERRSPPTSSLAIGHIAGYDVPGGQAKEAELSNGYQPKFPKEKLREIVSKYIGQIRLLGKVPSCTVGFCRDGEIENKEEVRGWLLDNRGPNGSPLRHLLLADGDVWREVESPAGSGLREWLQGPDDDLVMLLARSLAQARAAGNGCLADEEHIKLHPYKVDDRRCKARPGADEDRRQS